MKIEYRKDKLFAFIAEMSTMTRSVNTLIIKASGIHLGTSNNGERDARLELFSPL
ncbi:MAG: hypothetical protein M0P13_12080 [Fibrobacteraceae bacterium]|nr:hypothetical protein [Fibrobacteraceae bacterium]